VSQLAWWAALRGQLPQPVAFAGYSVGELAAYGVADALDAATLARLARDRARLMDAAAGTEPGGVIALRGISRAAAAEMCADKRHSSRSSSTKTHASSAVRNRALAAVKEAAGGRVRRSPCLRVGIASHTPLLAEAATQFRRCSKRRRCAHPCGRSPAASTVLG
jgi:[acyl-carrier-protein] S-malonyltransferase